MTPGKSILCVRRLQQFFAQPLCVVLRQAEGRLKDASFMFAYLVEQIQAVIAQLRDFHDSTFRIRQLQARLL